MHAQSDHYAILGVTSEATLEVIEAAYRRQVRRWHPDIAGPDGEMVTRQLNVAIATLRDPAQRQAYNVSLQRARGGIDVHYVVRIGLELARSGGIHRSPFSNADGSPLLIRIPPKAHAGMHRREVGRGSVDRSGVRGDLLVTFVVDPQLPSKPTPPITAARLARRIWQRVRSIVTAPPANEV